MNRPLLCVVIPAYNYAESITRAVTSVLKQVVDGCELIVINDGSTDNTEAVLMELLEKTNNAFKLISKENGGPASVRNLGLASSSADFFIFLDADDELLDSAIDDVLGFINKHPDVGMIIGGSNSVWKSENKTRTYIPNDLPSKALERVRAYLLTKSVSLSNGATVMHRNVFSKGYYPEYFRNAEDIPVFAQALANNNCMTLKKPLVNIYKSSESLRHNVDYDRVIGLKLIDEIFESGRLGEEFKVLKKPFVSQRALSLFRGYYVAGLYKEAKEMYHFAIANSWASIFKFSYTRKYIKAIFK